MNRGLLLVAAVVLVSGGGAPVSAGAVEAFPGGQIYAPYVADPRRPRFGLQELAIVDDNVPDASSSRVTAQAGGYLGLARGGPGVGPGTWQVNTFVNFHAVFDNEQSQDGLGWDGRYGLTWDRLLDEGLGLRVAFNHLSAHLGDEYIENNGRERLEYTREELVLGLSWRPNGRWRTYGEAAGVVYQGNADEQESGRVQAGLEYTTDAAPGSAPWYAALDLNAWEERNWRTDVTVQTGYLFERNGRQWRFGLEYYDGRANLGEFFTYDERYVGLGVWVDI